ncbi:hypothetical protein JTE90_008477 [Oedothorax gibbosus]|uniref:Uncharacterized protein n=1 Tax=Oedothorax gibbosus TaxID=931172 RepID=A0AAV6UYV2_9ARAC|nr:hypothetical protein JTE90_008477 [Oedothorax gibbosus]
MDVERMDTNQDTLGQDMSWNNNEKDSNVVTLCDKEQIMRRTLARLDRSGSTERSYNIPNNAMLHFIFHNMAQIKISHRVILFHCNCSSLGPMLRTMARRSVCLCPPPS